MTRTEPIRDPIRTDRTAVRPRSAEQLVVDLLEAYRVGEIDRIGLLVTEDFVDRGAPEWAPQGREGYVKIMRFLKQVMQVRYEIHETVARGDLVAVRATIHGIHNTGHLGFAPTGRPYAMQTMHMYRAAGALLAEHWGVRDELSMLWQVGALPAPQPVAL